MADSWDQFPDASNTAVADDPFAKFPDVAQPKQPTSLSSALSGIIGDSEAQQQMERTAGAQAPDWLQKTAHGVNRLVSGLIPRDVESAAGLLTPVVGAVEDIKKTGSILSDIASGMSVEDATRKHAPEAFSLADADKTPAFSQERYDAGIDVFAQMLMAGGISKGLGSQIRAQPKTLSETLAPVLGETPVEPAIPETRPAEAPAVAATAPEPVLATEVSPETAAAPVTPQGTRIAGPALVDTDGNIIVQGKLGETHADLLKRATEGPDADKAIAAFENDAQHVFVDDQGNALSREQAAPVGIAAGQLPEGTAKVESQMLKAELEPAPKTNTATEPAAADQSTTGIAQRVNEARTEAGRTGEILPGEGVSAEEMVNRGRELLKGGADPEAIIAGVSEGKAVTGDEMAVLRARREELSRVSDQAADALRKNPDDPALKQAADDAFKAETDFAQRIKPAATEWHKVGEAMQGETEVQTGTFTGLRRAFMERTGRDVDPKEAATLEKTADRVQKANAEVDKATADFSEVVKKETETTLPKSAEELRAHFADKFKKMLIC